MSRWKGKICRYCRRPLTNPLGSGTTAFTMDHVIPKVHGGRKMVPCCRACNEIKGDMTPDQWSHVMRTVPGWWGLYTTQTLRGMRLFTTLSLKFPTDR